MPLKEGGLEPKDMEVEQFSQENSRGWNKNLNTSRSTCPEEERIEK